MGEARFVADTASCGCRAGTHATLLRVADRLKFLPWKLSHPKGCQRGFFAVRFAEAKLGSAFDVPLEARDPPAGITPSAAFSSSGLGFLSGCHAPDSLLDRRGRRSPSAVATQDRWKVALTGDLGFTVVTAPP